MQKLVLPDHDSPQVLTGRSVVLLGLPIYRSHIIQPILKILHMMHLMMGLQQSWPAKNKNENQHKYTPSCPGKHTHTHTHIIPINQTIACFVKLVFRQFTNPSPDVVP